MGNSESSCENPKLEWEDDPNEAEQYPEQSRQHLKSASLRGNLMREQKQRDPYYVYETVAVLGVGSMGSVSKVKKKDRVMGGSSRKELVDSFHRDQREKKCFEIPIVGPIFKNCSGRDMMLSQGSSSGPGSEDYGVPKQVSWWQALLAPRTTVLMESKRSSSIDSLSSNENFGCTNKSKVYYALKSIHLKRVTDETFIDELKNEVEILKKLDHPHIVRPIETFEHRNQLFIVMEQCSGGDLYNRDPYTEAEAARILGMILSALCYMHELNICHRDLKYENVLFVNDSPTSEIKLIDFGLSKKYAAANNTMTDGVGTIYTMAPEVLKGRYTQQADLWSVGVMAYMLLSSQMPFYGRKRRHIVEQIMKCRYDFRGRRWKGISNQAKSFVSSLLVQDPDERATAEEAAGSTWLNRRYAATVRAPRMEELDNVQHSMKEFGDYSKLKKLALMVIAHKSTSEEIGILRKVFQEYDINKTGYIDFCEFQNGLAHYGYSDEDLELMFDGVDLDGSGKIRYTEFLAATIEAHGAIDEQRLAEAFDRLDSDDSGYISKENLREILGREMSSDEIDGIIKECDMTKDSRISYPEFLALWENKHEEKKENIRRATLSGLPKDSFSSSPYLLPSSEKNLPPELLLGEEEETESNTIARSNFLEEKKSSERRCSLIVEGIAPPSADPIAKGFLGGSAMPKVTFQTDPRMERVCQKFMTPQ